jgi:hypothetical protein
VCNNVGVNLVVTRDDGLAVTMLIRRLGVSLVVVRALGLAIVRVSLRLGACPVTTRLAFPGSSVVSAPLLTVMTCGESIRAEGLAVTILLFSTGTNLVVVNAVGLAALIVIFRLGVLSDVARAVGAAVVMVVAPGVYVTVSRGSDAVPVSSAK